MTSFAATSQPSLPRAPATWEARPHLPGAVSSYRTRPASGVSSWVQRDPHLASKVASRAAAQAKSHKSIFKKARRSVSKLHHRIARSIERGDMRQAEETLRTLVGSFSAKLLAFERANKSMKPTQRVETAQLVRMAEQLNPFTAEREKVQIWLRAKPDGRHRPIHRFGLRHRARQQLVVACLRPFLDLRDDQFAQAARGRNAAIREVVTRIEAGARWFAERDIVNCFGTFARSPSELVDVLTEWLPLPEEVVRHCITAVEYSFADHIPKEKCATVSLLVDSRQGLPQGSISSGLLAEARIAKALNMAHASPAMSGVSVIAYVDNLGLLAKHREDLRQSMATLERSIERCSLGSWRLNRRPKPRRVDHGFEFLGYHLRLRGSRVQVTVSQQNRERFVARVRELLKKVSRRSSLNLSEVRDYVVGWTSAFCEDGSARSGALHDLVEAGRDLCPHLVPQLRCIFEVRRTSKRPARAVAPNPKVRLRTRPSVHPVGIGAQRR